MHLFAALRTQWFASPELTESCITCMQLLICCSAWEVQYERLILFTQALIILSSLLISDPRFISLESAIQEQEKMFACRKTEECRAH